MPHINGAKPANLSEPEARAVAAAPVTRCVSPKKAREK